MAKIGMRRTLSAAGRPADTALAKALLGIVAVGIAGGATLITGAKKVGDRIENKRRNEQLEAARREVEADVQIESDASAEEVEAETV